MYTQVTLVASKRSDDPSLLRWTVRKSWYSAHTGTRDRVVLSGQFRHDDTAGGPLAGVRAVLASALAELDALEGRPAAEAGMQPPADPAQPVNGV